MKMKSAGIVAPISTSEMKELLKETKETIAIEVLKTPDTHKKFGAIDLWRVQRNHRTMFSKRRHS